MCDKTEKLFAKHSCCGCAACRDVCTKNAISMVADDEGFLYPRIDKAKCVGCGTCEEVCPLSKCLKPRNPLAVYAAKAKDRELRLASSSGGVFSLLAQHVVKRGGMVFGAAFDKSDWSVCHVGVFDEEGLAELRGSKYVQSRMAGVYRVVKDVLEEGREVLFSGTPCQIAALRCFLRKTYDNLILVDVICHGVPSPLVWARYLECHCETALTGLVGCAPTVTPFIRGISFRQKNFGWKRYSMSLRFANGKEYLSCFHDDAYMRVFLSELCSRRSCHDCSFRELRSGSDITLGDYWGVETLHREFDDDKGVSAVILNSQRGVDIFGQIQNGIDVEKAEFEDVVHGNSALVASAKVNRRRARFFRLLKKMSFCKLACDVTTSSWLRVKVGLILRKLGAVK